MKTAKEYADYIGQYANSGHKKTAEFILAQEATISELKRKLDTEEEDNRSYANAEYERRSAEEAHAHNMFIQCGGLE